MSCVFATLRDFQALWELWFYGRIYCLEGNLRGFGRNCNAKVQWETYPWETKLNQISKK